MYKLQRDNINCRKKNNLPKVVAQQRRGWASNPRLLDRKSDALPLSHRATLRHITYTLTTMCVIRKSTPTTTYTTRPTGTVTRIMCWSLSLLRFKLIMQVFPICCAGVID